ncbi:unnamed protein product [marine sediment metagenome]|uniref:Uncharacterized protein n=1 Tax=marine sediment metagenome TaxID=412755 RepID=X1JB28_9ZZZZ
MKDLPDFSPPLLALETPITKLKRKTTSSTDYVEVVHWTVSERKLGILRHVEMESDKYAKTRFKLTIAGVEQFKDQALEASLSLEWPDVSLAAESVVLLEAKATEVTEINVDGDILGKEVG